MNTRHQPPRQLRNKLFVFIFIAVLLFSALMLIFRDSLFNGFQSKCAVCDSTGLCVICESSGQCITCSRTQADQCNDCEGTGICSVCNGSGLCRICGIN